MPAVFVFLFLPSCFLIASAQSQAQNGKCRRRPSTIRETVVVTATGREMPESKVGATITVLESETSNSAMR